jgi:hypothetical protein
MMPFSSDHSSVSSSCGTLAASSLRVPITAWAEVAVVVVSSSAKLTDPRLPLAATPRLPPSGPSSLTPTSLNATLGSTSCPLPSCPLLVPLKRTAGFAAVVFFISTITSESFILSFFQFGDCGLLLLLLTL